MENRPSYNAPRRRRSGASPPAATDRNAGRGSERHVRVGDAERGAASERLAAHAAAGRLTIDELEARLDRVNAAVLAHDLDVLEADLPSPPSRRPAARRAPSAPLLARAAAVALVLALSTIAVGHPVVPPVLAVLLLWHAGRRRPGRAPGPCPVPRAT